MSKPAKDPNRYLPRAGVWYLSDALLVVRKLQAVLWPLQHHVALGGGVLNHGYSENDLDIYVLPLYGKGEDAQRIVRGIQNTKILEAIDLVLGAPIVDYTGSQDSGDETCFLSSLRHEDSEGRNIDVFVVRA